MSRDALRERHTVMTPAVIGCPVEEETGGGWQQLVHCSTAEARALLPYEHARAFGVLPLGVIHQADERLLVVLVSRKLSIQEQKEIRFIAGVDLELEDGEPSAVCSAIRIAYHGDPARLASSAVMANDEIARVVDRRGSTERPDEQSLLDAAGEKPVPQLLDSLLARAYALGASDLHLEPMADELRIRIRVAGMLAEERVSSVRRETARHIMRRIKVLGGLDITHEDRPQEGAFLWYPGGRESPHSSALSESVRVRVSLQPQIFGEKAVLRLLEHNRADLACDLASTSFRRLGLTQTQERLLALHIAAERGSILVAGPTGSGKSTLLYTILGRLNEGYRNIVSLEDPVERIIPGVNQIPVERRGARSFAEILPAVLRQDPDVVMIGEIRERETAEIALTASITGHLVLSTIHAGNAFEVLTRLRQFGLSPELVGTALRVVIAQRLVPLNCERCTEPTRVSEELRRFFAIEEIGRLRRARGCERCRGTGIGGRRGVYELLSVTPAIRELLIDGGGEGDNGRWCSINEIREQAIAEGFQTLAVPVRELLQSGAAAPAHACRVLGIPVEAR